MNITSTAILHNNEQPLNSEKNYDTEDIRKKQKQEIMQAVKHGNLSFRTISKEEEINYLQQQNKDPRPVYLIAEGVPIKMRSNRNTIGIINPKPLALYKRNACTSQLLDNSVQLDKLAVKCLANQQELKKKITEQSARLWDVYSGFTSGHLKPNGLFALPKLKQITNNYNNAFIDHSELVTTSYDKTQIKCYCVPKNNDNKITDILKEKQVFENAFKIKPLPLLVYCEESGTIEIYFDNELSSGSLLEVNENKLAYFANSLNFSEKKLIKVLNFLPMPVISEILSSSSLTSSLNTITEPTTEQQELLKYVTNPECYNQERFLAINDSGFPLQTKILHEGGVMTLVDILISTITHNYLHTKFNKIAYTESTQALTLFIDLIKSGVSISKSYANRALSHFPQLTVCKYMKAMNISFSGTEVFSFSFCNLFKAKNPVVILEFEQRCKKANQIELQKQLHSFLVKPFQAYTPYDSYQNNLLALMHYAVPSEQTLAATRKKIESTTPQGIKQSLGDKSADFYIQWVKELEQKKQQYVFFQEWSKLIAQANEEISTLKKSLDLPSYGDVAPATTQKDITTDLQFIIDAFAKPPNVLNLKDIDATVLTILQHYYRRPGYQRIIRSLSYNEMPEIWKPTHACNHVLRARNNSLWYMELLEKFQICSFSDDEKTLLSIASIYHDAAAEDIGKELEEIKAASYFKRDLQGQYSQELLNAVALALESKENDINNIDEQLVPADVRRYVSVLRFADRMDIIRCTGVENDFPGLSSESKNHSSKKHQFQFDSSLLDIPAQVVQSFTSNNKKKSDFQRNLEAAMHGAADLVQITDNSKLDKRSKNYIDFYQLNISGKQIKEKFECTTTPVRKMDDFIDDNVRRKIAILAEITTCATADHKNCQSDPTTGITRGIHNSWYDLKQIKIPSCMTLLEKMQCEHDITLLSQETQQAIETEVVRLKREGILMNLGTLTQETLKSTAAKKILKHRGVSIITEKRCRGYDKKTANAIFEEILVPLTI